MSESTVHAPNDVFLKVDGIHCAACVDKISRALEETKLCESYWVDRSTNVIRLRQGHAGITEATFIDSVRSKLKKLGYESEILSDPTKSRKNEWIGQLCFASLGLLVSIFLLPHQSVPFPRQDLLILLGVVVLFFLSFKSFARGAFVSLKIGEFGVDTLVSLGAGSAFFLSMCLIIGQIPGHLFWVEAFAILLLVSLGHFIENYVLVKADKTLRSLMVLSPPKAILLLNGKNKEVDVGELSIGDVVVLRPGDRVPVDGKIIEGRSDFNESFLTGEAMPLAKGVGDDVFAGTINLSGNLNVRVTKLGKDTVLAQVIETVVRVRQTRANIQKMADQISNIFVPTVVVIAVAAFFAWYFAPEYMDRVSNAVGELLFMPDSMGDDVFWRAFSAALGVMVISCPCAMGLATPSALIAVSGIAAKRGILIRDGRAIETAEKIKHVFFDKTGTLSSASPKKINEWKTAEFDERFLGAVASQSKHPMSRALAAMAPASAAFKANIQELPGEGIKASLQSDGRLVEIVMGNGTLIQRLNISGMNKAQDFVLAELEQGRSLVYWSQEGRLTAIFSFEDDIREGAEEILRKFSTQAEVHILSGDNKKVLSALATKFGLNPDYVLGELTPLDKVRILESYQSKGSKVAFIGDGINDAPVLHAADLGIAVSTASDLAKQSADIILISQDINAIFEAFQLAKKGMKTIRQNLIWAFAYNIIAIPLAFLGLISPILCTVFMAFSDFVIILNSLRVFLSRKPL